MVPRWRGGIVVDVSNGRYILKIIESKVQSWRSQRGGHNSFFFSFFLSSSPGLPPRPTVAIRRFLSRPVPASSFFAERRRKKKMGKKEIILRRGRGGTRSHYRKSVEELRHLTAANQD